MLDPLEDPRWDDVVRRHSSASVFHTRGWLRSLQRTYAFAPLAFTTARDTEPLRNAVVLCGVRSWLSGNRLVSLPFSDHCEPLIDDAEELRALCRGIDDYRARQRFKYVELRPAMQALAADTAFEPAERYFLHRLDLGPSLEDLWRGFHADSIQRRIRRAEAAKLTYEEGRSDALVAKLYHLLGLTRERHRLPVQPRAWFRNLVECLGESVCICVVSYDGEPAAGILSITHGTTVVYKYGGSDARHHRLGGMPFLFWKLIQDAKQRGARLLDFGRTDRDNNGLIVFKERWGASRSEMTYWRSPGVPARRPGGRGVRFTRRAFFALPAPLRRAAADVLYRHLA